MGETADTACLSTSQYIIKSGNYSKNSFRTFPSFSLKKKLLEIPFAFKVKFKVLLISWSQYLSQNFLKFKCLQLCRAECRNDTFSRLQSLLQIIHFASCNQLSQHKTDDFRIT